jgi:3-oxoacyl-[acyl-carrier protein] reductase
MLSASFISTLIGTKMPGAGALWYSQTITFLQPVWIGDEIRVVGTISKKSESQRSFIIKIEIYNQNNQLVITGESQVKVPVVKDYQKVDDPILSNGVIIVIGGTGGIGESIIERLLSNGKRLIFTYLKNNNLATDIVKKHSSKIEKYCLDICDEVAIKNFINYTITKYERIDSLINCATDRIINNSFEKLTWESIDKQINIHLKSVFCLAKQVIPHFLKNKYGKIVNISSIYSDATPPLNLYDYVIAKSALCAFTKGLALEYGPYGININIVSPSMTETSLIAAIPEKTKLLTMMQTPLRRLARPEDIAGAVAFLISEEFSFITGETIRINGGQLML